MTRNPAQNLATTGTKANRMSVRIETEDDRGSVENSDAINAFNTEDALKNDVNPVHPVPVASVFGGSDRFDLNSSRTLVERKQATTPSGQKFNTPAGRSLHSVAEFD